MLDKRQLKEALKTFKIGSDWIRLDQIGSDWIKLDDYGENCQFWSKKKWINIRFFGVLELYEWILVFRQSMKIPAIVPAYLLT